MWKKGDGKERRAEKTKKGEREAKKRKKKIGKGEGRPSWEDGCLLALRKDRRPWSAAPRTASIAVERQQQRQ